jgi:competence protein ComEA
VIDDPQNRSDLGRGARRQGLRARCDHVLVDVAARTGVSPRAVLSLLLIALLLVGLLAARTATTKARARPRTIAAAQTLAVAGSTPAPGSASTQSTVPVPGGSPSPSGAQVVVHVVGQVRRAGVVRLPAGSRVQDALAAAGGPRTAADLTAVNLARQLVDGEQVVVPKPGQVVALPSSPAPGSTGPGSGGGAAGGGVPVDLNTASAEQLDALPGVGPVLAGRILDWRAQHGRFSSVDELGEVSGIGEKVLANLRPMVRV